MTAPEAIRENRKLLWRVPDWRCRRRSSIGRPVAPAPVPFRWPVEAAALRPYRPPAPLAEELRSSSSLYPSRQYPASPGLVLRRVQLLLSAISRQLLRCFILVRQLNFRAGRLGFEPRQSAPKALDLPLVDRPVFEPSALQTCHPERRRTVFGRRSRRTPIAARTAVPTGLVSLYSAHPALKRWAKLFRRASRDSVPVVNASGRRSLLLRRCNLKTLAPNPWPRDNCFQYASRVSVAVATAACPAFVMRSAAACACTSEANNPYNVEPEPDREA